MMVVVEVDIDNDFLFDNCLNGNISNTHLKRKVFWSTNLSPVSMQDLLQKQLPLWNNEFEPLWEKCDKIIYYDVCLVFLHK